MSQKLILNATRIKRCFSDNGINAHLQDRVNDVEGKILNMKKIGAPKFSKTDNPKRPVLAKTATAAEKKKYETELKQYETAKAKYEEAQKAWNQYKSSQFLRSKRMFSLVKLLRHIDSEMKNPNQTKPRRENIVELNNKLNDPKTKPVVLKDLGLKSFPAPEKYEQLCQKIISEEGDRYQLFEKQEAIRHEKLRLGGASVPLMTHFAQIIMSDLIKQTVKYCKQQKRKKISLEDCSPDALQSSVFYRLVQNFAAFNQVREYLNYKQYHKALKQNTNKEISNIPGSTIARQVKAKTQRQQNIISFEKLAVKKGYMVETDKGYKWVGIEVDENGNEDNKFTTHVGKLIKECMKPKAADKPSNVGHIVTCFYAKLLEEFIESMSNRVKIWKQYDGSNKQTVSPHTLTMLFKLMLLGVDHDIDFEKFIADYKQQIEEKKKAAEAAKANN